MVVGRGICSEERKADLEKSRNSGGSELPYYRSTSQCLQDLQRCFAINLKRLDGRVKGMTRALLAITPEQRMKGKNLMFLGP